MHERHDMTFTISYAWWWVPAAFTVLFLVWAALPSDGDPVQALIQLVAALAAISVFWAVGGILK